PRPMLYSREPRSSACPSRRTFWLGFFARKAACAATTDCESARISALSKSKYTTRLDSSSPDGPAASVSSAVAPELSAPLVLAVDSGGGSGFTSGFDGQPASSAKEAKRTAVERKRFIATP